MSQNNNPQYPYNNRYSYTGGHASNPATSIGQNTNSYQPTQQATATNTPLLPYHEYMAMQKKNSINTVSDSQPVSQPSMQPYQPAVQPYYYQQPTYQYAPQYPQPYNPYQPQPYNYYSQPPTANYYPPVQTDIKPQVQSMPISSQTLPKIQPTKSTNAQTMPQTSMHNRDSQKQQSRHSPSPMKNTEFNRKQQSVYSPNKQQQKRPFTARNSQSNYKQNQQQNSPRKYNNNNNYRQNNYDYKQRINQEHADEYNMDISSNDGWSEEQEQQEMLYQKYESKKNNYYGKSKQITKKKDSVADDPEQIRKWIQARKRNYPGLNKKLLKQANQIVNDQNETQQRQRQKERQEMSRLESKIRKKLIIINGDSRSIMKKIKNIQILRRIVQDPKILKRQRKNRYNNNYQTNKPKMVDQTEQKVEVQNIVGEERVEQIAENKLVEQIVEEQVPVEQKQIIEKHQSSQSEQSVQPQQVPANKTIPQHIENQIIEEEKKKQIIATQLFQFVQKQKQQPTSLVKEIRHEPERQGRREPKVLDPETIIAHLKQKQNEDRQSLNTLFDYKSNSHSYNYRVQTLQTSLKLDEIFAQTTYLLQAIRYIAKQNFFDDLKK